MPVKETKKTYLSLLNNNLKEPNPLPCEKMNSLGSPGMALEPSLLSKANGSCGSWPVLSQPPPPPPPARAGANHSTSPSLLTGFRPTKSTSES